MKSVWLALPVLAMGCGPLVVLPAETDGGEGSSTAGTTGGGGVSTDRPQTDGSGEEGPFTTTPPMPTTAPPVTTGFGSTGFGSSGQPPATICWSSSPIFELPEESRLFVIDQDGDGTDELWVGFFNGDGPGGATDLFQLAEGGAPIPAGLFPGFLTGLHDINGDGVLDGVGFTFGGGPPDLGFIPGEPGMIEGEPIPTSLGFEGGFLAFHDASGDGLADFFRNDEGTMTTNLLAGDGAGTFMGTPSMPAPFVGDVAVTPTGDPSLVVLSQADFFDPTGECSEHPFSVVSVTGNTLAQLFDGTSDPEWLLSAPLKAEGSGTAGTIYARACRPGSTNVTLQVTTFEGARNDVTWFADSSFVSVGDFDGDGRDDAALGNLDGGVEFRRGLGGGEFDAPTFDDAPYGPPVANRVYAVDIDLDGRDEVILGTRDGGTEIVYEQLDLEECF